ncbi:hypothetical protein AAG747_12560 [Rapidithrix thailandica]|uniref:Uncharacterized protein n=1 Tax=Rapidithrix thailandica TaxID=413964 RepID=A0AAW9S6T7_9BACT
MKLLALWILNSCFGFYLVSSPVASSNTSSFPIDQLAEMYLGAPKTLFKNLQALPTTQEEEVEVYRLSDVWHIPFEAELAAYPVLKFYHGRLYSVSFYFKNPAVLESTLEEKFGAPSWQHLNAHKETVWQGLDAQVILKEQKVAWFYQAELTIEDIALTYQLEARR